MTFDSQKKGQIDQQRLYVHPDDVKRKPTDWTTARVLELIHQYKKTKILWDYSFQGFKSKKDVDLAWDSVGSAMHVHPAECRRKMNILVGQFHRECRKEETLAAKGESFLSPWFPYAHMTFLKKRRAQIQKQKPKPVNTVFDLHQRTSHDPAEKPPISASVSPTTTDHSEFTQTFRELFPGIEGPESDNDDKDETMFVKSEEDGVNGIAGDGFTNVEDDSLSSFQMLEGVDFGPSDEFETPSSPLEKKFVGPRPDDGTTEFRDGSDIFGTYVAAKLKHLASDDVRDKAECLITNLLFEATRGTFDFSGV
ncbi:hypothetical protein GE061_010656 [Apolygus lucorum]|uniref:Uncharacterized protein n=1 Tax=Apolygus lucorum TaxID=248454 RepID=A0A6A4JT92_APOLU|nr:hypothetical protein GE061_010656 [Apolygus lucorum]